MFSCVTIWTSLIFYKWQVWNVSEKEYQIIQHMTTSGGISRLSFSPDGSKVMAATPGSSFRIFEAATWTNERWSNLAGRVQVRDLVSIVFLRHLTRPCSSCVTVFFFYNSLEYISKEYNVFLKIFFKCNDIL